MGLQVETRERPAGSAAVYPRLRAAPGATRSQRMKINTNKAIARPVTPIA